MTDRLGYRLLFCAERTLASMRLWVALSTLAWSLSAATAAIASQSASKTATGYAEIRRACPTPRPASAQCFALVRASVAAGTAGARPYTLDAGASSAGPAGGLTPSQLASAYRYTPTASGAGQTVAIVDAFDDPSIEKDLAAFDGHYGLAPCTTADGCFKKVGQSGSTASLPAADKTGWSGEISLDVEAVHSVCPNCKILLVEANSESYRDLATAVNEAVSLGATEVSNSYGGPEEELGAAEEAAYNHPGVVIAAATGDDGYYDWDVMNQGYLAPQMPNAPASLPSVVAVGGTSLRLNEEGTRATETVWNDNGPNDEIGLLRKIALGATGGGCSRLFGAQPWQQNIPGFATDGCGNKRLDADIAAVADPLTGFDIYDSFKCGTSCEATGIGKGWATVGGTSLSAPLITSLYALAGGSGGIRDPALTLYGHIGDPASLYDVTLGGNGYCDGQAASVCGQPNRLLKEIVDCEGTLACTSAPGFDGPSGVGAPNGLNVFTPLLPSAAIAAPTTLRAGATASFTANASTDPYPGGSLASYSWSWGDGSASSSGVSATHTFAAPGTYVVRLVVGDDYGLASAAAVQSVAVGPSLREEELLSRSVPIIRPHTALASRVQGAELASKVVTASATGRIGIKIYCPAAEGSCTGTVTIRTLVAVAASAGHLSTERIITLATGKFTISGGRVSTITLRLSAKARQLLTRVHVLRAQVTIVAHSGSGAAHTRHAIVTLRSRKQSG